MNKKMVFNKFTLSAVLVLSSSLFNACVPNSAIPSMFILNNPANPNNPVTPIVDPGNGNPTDPNNGNNNNGNTELPNNPNNGNNGNHPAPPDPQQPKTEDDFWILMKRFGFMQTRTKEQLLADIKVGVAMKITGWSTGTLKDVNKNILSKYTNASTKKYMNPYPKTVEEYTAKSMTLAKKANKDVDFYLDVEYGAKDGKGVINMQRIEPKTLEVLYYNKSGLITNYTQTALPETGPPALLRLTHFMFIPPAVYN